MLGVFSLNLGNTISKLSAHTVHESTPAKFKNSSSSILKTDAFKWNTIDGKAPYIPDVLIELDFLEETLNNEYYGVGVKTEFIIDLLEKKYK